MQLYISDLDGTLLNSAESLSMRTIEIINRLITERGLNFTLATARSINSSEKFFELLKLRLPVVLNNGIFIYDPVTKKNIVENLILFEDLPVIVKEFEEEKLNLIVYTADGNEGRKVYYKGIFNQGETDYIQRRLDENDKRFYQVKDYDVIPRHTIMNFLVIDKKENIEHIYMKLKAKHNYSLHFYPDIYSKYYWLEINNINASKKTGVSFIKSYLKASKIISFGDNLNDLPMFEVSDEKYAVSNANDELKTHSTEVIGSNDRDGVAEFLEERFR